MLKTIMILISLNKEYRGMIQAMIKSLKELQKEKQVSRNSQKVAQYEKN